MKRSIFYSVIISMIGISSIGFTYSVYKSTQIQKEIDKEMALSFVEYGKQCNIFLLNKYPNKSNNFIDSIFKFETEKFVNKLYK